jgi:hypothetical protein
MELTQRLIMNIGYGLKIVDAKFLAHATCFTHDTPYWIREKVGSQEEHVTIQVFQSAVTFRNMELENRHIQIQPLAFSIIFSNGCLNNLW